MGLMNNPTNPAAPLALRNTMPSHVADQPMPTSCPNPTLAVVESVERQWSMVGSGARYMFSHCRLVAGGFLPLLAAFQVAIMSRLANESIEACVIRCALESV